VWKEGINSEYDKVNANSNIARSSMLFFQNESEDSNESHDLALVRANGVDKNGDC
jgi:hypothetical protein